MTDHERLWARLRRINERIDRIASEEARAAWVNGAAADGRFIPEKERLIEQAEKILDDLERGLRNA